MSSSSSLVVTASFVLVILTGSLGALAVLSSPASPPEVEAPGPTGSSALVAAAPAASPALENLPAPAAHAGAPVGGAGEAGSGKSEIQASSEEKNPIRPAPAAGS